MTSESESGKHLSLVWYSGRRRDLWCMGSIWLAPHASVSWIYALIISFLLPTVAVNVWAAIPPPHSHSLQGCTVTAGEVTHPNAVEHLKLTMRYLVTNFLVYFPPNSWTQWCMHAFQIAWSGPLLFFPVKAKKTCMQIFNWLPPILLHLPQYYHQL